MRKQWPDTLPAQMHGPVVYESIGFVPTGVQHTLPWNASVTESELRLELGS